MHDEKSTYEEGDYVVQQIERLQEKETGRVEKPLRYVKTEINEEK